MISVDKPLSRNWEPVGCLRICSHMSPWQVYGPRWIKDSTRALNYKKTWSLFSHKILDPSVVNWHLNSRSPFHKDHWVSSADFISDLFFIISWSYWCFRGSGGKWESPGRVSAFEFRNSTIQRFILMFTKTMSQGHFGQWGALCEGWSLRSVHICPSSLLPLPPSLSLFLSLFFPPLYQHVVACDTS